EVCSALFAAASGYGMSAKQSIDADGWQATATKPRTIALLEHCGTGNLGDDATGATALQQIKNRWPTAFVIGLSLDPVDSERRHGIPCFAIRQSVFPFMNEWSSASRPAKRVTYLGSLKASLK